MTIASAGYSGTVTQENWATMAQFAGVDTAVATATDCVVTGAAGTRAVSVSPGVAWGWGVLDTLSGTNTVSLAANGTGQTRWDAVVVRRNWSTGTTTIAAVTGTSAEAVPSLTVTPGVLADQVLALVAVPAGATTLEGATVRPWVQWPVQTTYGPRAPHGPSYGQRWVDSSTGNTYSWDGSLWVDTSSSSIGDVKWGGWSTVPTGWHLCDGSLHGSAALAAVIGSTRTPDLRDRFVVAAGGAYAKGDTGGLAAVPLNATHMPSHAHGGATATASAPHSHTVQQGNIWITTYNEGLAGGNFAIAGSSLSGLGDLATGSDNASHAHTINAEGGGLAHENRPPYYALTAIMRKA